MRKLYLSLALGATVAGSALGAGPTAEMLAYTCAGCHGTDGSSVGPASPSIAGTDPVVFTDAMLAYKHEERESTIMTRIAKAYTENQIEAMAEFFAAQKLVVYPQEFDREKAARGKQFHDDYCEKCHEDGGRNPQDVGVLAGQWMPYLHIAMEDFLIGAREQPKKMKTKVDGLIEDHGKEALDDLVHYYGSQK